MMTTSPDLTVVMQTGTFFPDDKLQRRTVSASIVLCTMD